MKKIAIFNHKGGVSKTTTAFNLGWSIWNLGHSVLFVDTDSQCNLTLYSLGAKKYNDFYEDSANGNIYNALLPAFKSQPRLIDPAKCEQIKEGLYLLPGHLDFAENEVQLGIAMQLSNAFGSMQNLPGAINYLITKTAEEYNAEYVIIDMNPSLSSINQDILISSDFFIVPTSPDYFSIMAIRSLSRVFVNWEKWAKSARPLFKDVTYPLPNKTPIFLGYTVNDFNLTHGNPQYTFQTFIDRISDEVVNTLIPNLHTCGMTYDNSKYVDAYEAMKIKSDYHNIDYKDQFCLAQISNLNKLIAISNENSIPIFEIRLDQAHEGQRRTLDWFKFLYKVFAERIIQLCGYDE